MGEHFGREIHTARFFWFKTKAVYPIIALSLGGSVLACLNMAKNGMLNFNVAIDRRNIIKWNKEAPVTILGKEAKPVPKVMPEADI